MGRFQSWLSKKGYFIEEMGPIQQGLDANPVEKFHFNDDPKDYANDHDQLLTQVIKIAMSKAPQETLNFLRELGRDDEELADLVSRLGDGHSFKHLKKEMPPEVVPSIADQGRGDAGPS